MKRVFSVIVLLALLALFYQFGVLFFKKGHQVDYSIAVDGEQFKIREIYERTDRGYYRFQIDHEKDHFVFETDVDYNKRKEIIEEIQFIDHEGLFCILPIYLKGELHSNLQCSKDGKLYSYSAVSENPAVISFVESLSKQKLSLPAWQKQSEAPSFESFYYYYPEDFLANDEIILWNYRGIQMLSKENKWSQTFLQFDRYENSHAQLIGKYYLVPQYFNEKLFEFERYIVYDIVARKQTSITIGQSLSSSTYIQGVVDGKLYIFDPKNLVQYEINPKKEESRLVGNKEINAQYYDGTWKDRNIYDFVSTPIRFETVSNRKVIFKKYAYQEILETDRYYFFYDAKGNVYQLFKDDLDHPVFLFQKPGLTSVQAVGDSFYFLVEDTIYYWQAEQGLRQMVRNSEFKYNHNNMYAIYKN